MKFQHYFSWLLPILCLLTGPLHAAGGKERNAQKGDYVIVIHGLGWLRDTLKPTVKHLTEEGYETVRFSYDSRKPLNVISLNQGLDELIKTNCPDPKRRIHFVAHSMGCIVTRSYLDARQPKNLGQVVLIAPPNQGTELADLVGKSKILKEVFGKGAPDLGTSPDSLPNRLPPPSYKPGVIMGDRSMFPPLSWMLKGPDDGVIRVERGKVAGMGGFVVVPANHTRIPGARPALEQMDCFLTTGAFSPPVTVPEKG